MGELTVVGEITLLQIQRTKLRDGRVYKLDPILAVERLLLTPAGVWARRWILDPRSPSS